ncbi:MAG TPA: GDP-mannose 4,6-dehydratase [Candidatus Eisenbacteria bacterium]
MRIGITGVAGFAGRHLIRALDAAPGRELHGGDRLDPAAAGDDPDLRSRLASYRSLDVSDREALGAWVRDTRPEAVVHLAAQASGADSYRDPAGTYRVNALGSLHLLEAVRTEAPAAAVLLVGSADAYGSGAPGERLREDAPLRPQNPYAVSKAAADALGELYATSFALRVVRTRTFSHTGPGQRPRFALASFADQLARMDAGLLPPEVHVGNLDGVRDYGDVRDVVRAYELLLTRGEPGEVYNVCTGVGHPLSELLQQLIRISGVRADVIRDPERVRARDAGHLVGDPARLAAQTGWRPGIPIEQTLNDLYRDARERVRAETKR